MSTETSVREKFPRRALLRTAGAAIGAIAAAPHIPGLANSTAEARQPKGAPEDIIQLNSNENPYGPSPRALDAINKSRRVAARYPDALEDRMVEAIAALHGVKPEQVLLGCGSGEILRMADMAFLNGDKAVVVAEPTFEAVLAYARVTRAEAVKVPLNAEHRHDLPAMAAACNGRTGVVYLCNPNNPTATIFHRDELAAFLERAPRSATIVLDEAYHHFVEDPRYASGFDFLPKYSNLVVVRTFSKIFGMAGMRLGYAVSTPENIRAMREHSFWNNSNAAVLEAALASLNDSAHVAQQRRAINSTRAWLCRELERDARRYIPSHANFVMIDVGTDVAPLIPKFRERNLLVGRKFPSLANWLRISIGTPKEMRAFVTALRAIVPAGAAAARAA